MTRFETAHTLLKTATVQRAFPAAAIEVGTRDRVLWQEAFGALSYDPDAAPATGETIFDLASLTKVLATTTVMMELVERGRVRLEDRVGHWLPEWRGSDRELVTVADLLEHSSGLTPHLPFFRDHSGRDEYQQAICSMPLEYQPRSQAAYSDLGFILLGFIAEAAGAPLDLRFSSIALRCGLGEVRYRPPRTWRGRTAPTEVDAWRGRLLVAEVHDENAWALRGVAGHSGLFGSAAAVGRFARLILRTGHGETVLVRPETLSLFTARSQVPGSSRARGWDTMLPTSSCGTRMSSAAIGHTGFTGTSLWIDPVADVYVVFLTNRVHPSRANDAILRVRPSAPRRGHARGRGLESSFSPAAKPETGHMSLTLVDWIILVLYFSTPLAIGLYYYRAAGTNVREFFLSGRDLPWWLAGTSMVATTFAADTPLAVAGLVGQDGIAGNWIWWNAALGSMLTVFLFSRLWRRAGVLTDVELVELRYTGRQAAILRAFRALYLGIPINCVVMGWVNLAMAKVLAVTMEWDRLTAVLISLALTGLYSALAGLRGIVVADFFQFGLAWIGTGALAWFALRLPAVGGIDGLREQLPEEAFRFAPRLSESPGDTSLTLALPVAAFVAYIGVQWWASWYPGQEPGGGGYVAQRMMSAKDERHAFLATLWFVVAHYCLRPWPWILVALASLVLYPELADREAGYAMVMRDALPGGWRGLLLGAFFAAYMSTTSTQLNWGTSYVVNDVYRRFIKADAAESHYVLVSRLTTLTLVVASGALTFYLESIRQAWEFILESGAGIGLVLILRWYWWRVNAWSEIAGDGSARAGSRVPSTIHRYRVSEHPVVPRGVDDGRVARGHVPDPARADGPPYCVLPSDSTGWAGLGQGCRSGG